MFGLMQADTTCTSGEYPSQRYHYCGTCKVIGNNFGQSARAMLNYDAVFLAELLSGLANDSTKNWNPALQAVNQCWVLPGKKEENPVALQYAAAANLLFAELKIKDNIADKGPLWRVVELFYKNSFQKAIAKLEQWGLDAKSCYAWAEEQQKRETAPISDFKDFNAYLNYCAEPTAKLTEAVFATAAMAIEKPGLEAELETLGYAFGSMMYYLDALEDVEKDRKKGHFNPLLSWYQQVGEAEKAYLANSLEECRQTVENQLLKLPLAKEKIAEFAARLQTNIAKRQYRWEEQPSPNFKERMLLRWNYAKEATGRIVCAPTGPMGNLQYNLLVLAFFIVPQAAGKEGGFSVQSFLLGFLSLMGLGLLLKGVIPRREKRKRRKGKRRKKDCRRQCRRQGDACRDACICMLVIISILIVLFVLGIIFGSILLAAGSLFWGLFLILIIPVLVGLTILIFSIAIND